MQRSYILAFGFLLSVLFLTAGCGPIKSTLVMVDAEKQLDQAEKLEAPEKIASVYYYWASKEYLAKAWEEHGYSDFQASERFGQKALSLALKAVEKAKKGKKRVYDPDASPAKTKKAKDKNFGRMKSKMRPKKKLFSD